MKRQHRKRQPRGHQQLNVRHVREDVRAEREADRGDHGSAPIADDVPHEVVHARSLRAECQQHHRSCAPRTGFSSPRKQARPGARRRDCFPNTRASRCEDRRCSRRTHAPDRSSAHGPPRRHSRSKIVRPHRRARSRPSLNARGNVIATAASAPTRSDERRLRASRAARPSLRLRDGREPHHHAEIAVVGRPWIRQCGRESFRRLRGEQIGIAVQVADADGRHVDDGRRVPA